MRSSRAELVDFARERTLSLLRRWEQVAPDTDGLLQPTHGPAWEPDPDRRRTLVTQARFAHNFVAGWRMTGEERWRELARSAAHGLRTRFPLTPCGLPVFAVDASGAVADGRVWSYGAAFALFGLAQGALVDDDPAITATAEQWWEAFVKLRDAQGGWAWMYTPEGGAEIFPATHNPIMHLFEALLAWVKIDAAWQARAEEVLAFMRDRLLVADGPWVPEFFDPHWRPWAGRERCYLSIGHQWEWAHLLLQAQGLGLAGAEAELARMLAASAQRLGLHAADHLVSRVNPDGEVVLDAHLYWDYCEAARACLWLTVEGEAPEFFALVPGLMHGLEQRCYDQVNGGYATRGVKAPQGEPKGQIWRVDYHQVALFQDLIALEPWLPADA